MYENAHGYHFITWEEMEAYEKEHGLLPPGVPVIVAGVKVR